MVRRSRRTLVCWLFRHSMTRLDYRRRGATFSLTREPAGIVVMGWSRNFVNLCSDAWPDTKMSTMPTGSDARSGGTVHCRRTRGNGAGGFDHSDGPLRDRGDDAAG